MPDGSSLFSAIPERFCGRCGRKMVVRIVDSGFDPKTGSTKEEAEQVCPRFDRSWRNLWFGGVMHEGVVYFNPTNLKHSLSLEWR